MPATPLVRPNIVLLMVDDSLPDQWTPEFTPFTYSKPGGDWVLFPRALSETPLCAPARVAVLTGQTARRTGVRNNEDGATVKDAGLVPTRLIQAALRNAGYFTSHHGKYLNGYPWIPEDSPLPGVDRRYVPGGWSDWHATGGSGFFGNRVMNNGVWSPFAAADYHVTDLMADYLVANILGGTPQAGVNVVRAPEPFFMHVGIRAPHKPSDPAIRHQNYRAGHQFARSLNYNEVDADETKPAWFRRNQPPTVNVADDSGVATDAIAHFGDPISPFRLAEIDEHHLDAQRCNKGIDELIERVYNALVARGVLDHTIIILCGDNSNAFGEHRHNTKGVPYQESMNPHLRIRYPGAGNRTEDALVTNVDFAATWADLAGARPMLSMQGMSFRRVLEGSQASEDFRRDVLIQRGQEEGTVQFGPGTWDGVQTYDGWKYVKYVEDDEVELYDLNSDPYELVNLANVPEHAPRVRDLHFRMVALLGSNGFEPGQ